MRFDIENKLAMIREFETIGNRKLSIYLGGTEVLFVTLKRSYNKEHRMSFGAIFVEFLTFVQFINQKSWAF